MSFSFLYLRSANFIRIPIGYNNTFPPKRNRPFGGHFPLSKTFNLLGKRSVMTRNMTFMRTPSAMDSKKLENITHASMRNQVLYWRSVSNLFRWFSDLLTLVILSKFFTLTTSWPTSNLHGVVLKKKLKNLITEMPTQKTGRMKPEKLSSRP